MTQPLDLHVLGRVALYLGDVERPIVASRKTRALLGYLAITGRPHSREHLCELFFDRTSDPRGALRWSLSKLRVALGDYAASLITSNDQVVLDLTDIRLDLDLIRQTFAATQPQTADLLHCAQALSDNPLGQLRLARAADFDGWLCHERDVLAAMFPKIMRALAADPDVPDETALKWLRYWVRVAPQSQDAAHGLWQRLVALDRHAEANDVATAYRRLVGDRDDMWYSAPVPLRLRPTHQQKQTLGYCYANDGVRIAYASVGQGPPLVKAANWLNHLELDWQSPIWGDTFAALSKDHRFIRYDERGNGLSDWTVPDISQAAFVDDLETVVDAMNLRRFPLLGMSQGCAVSIDYAVRHPERVSSLILVGGYAAGWRIGMTAAEREQREAVMTLTRHGWGTSNPAYRHIFSQTFMPGADAERLAWFDDFQRQTTSPENAVRFQEAFGDIDVRPLLKHVKVPTLVLHAKDDQRIPLIHGQELADSIPNARLVTLDSSNHIILGDEPAWQTFVDEVKAFLAEHG